MSNQNNFRSIFKSTFLFGGSQVIVLLISLIRNKFAALFLGAAGLGLNGIFLSTINLIKAITSLGINESAVRDIAKANATGDNDKIRLTYSVFKFWVLFTGSFGVICMLIFAPFISLFAFKSEQYALQFRILSLVLVFVALSDGVNTFLRGMQKIQVLAASNIISATLSLIFTVTFYYFLGIEGVVPSLVTASIITFLISLYYKKKFKLEANDIGIKDLISKGGPMVKLGLSLTTVTILSSGVTFILNSYILKQGGLHDVGLFGAGNSIIEFYIGMVFTSIATDFFPRLSSMLENEIEWKKLINEQLELAFLLLTLGLVILVSTAPFLVRLLLSNDLLDSVNYIYAAVLYIPFKVMVWIPGFLLIAKGQNKLFLTIEVIGNILLLTLSILFYRQFGLVGLGYGLVVYYMISFFATFMIIYNKFKLNYTIRVWTLFTFAILSIAICIALKTWLPHPYSIFAELTFAMLVVWFTLFQLNKRINLNEFVRSFFIKITKKK